MKRTLVLRRQQLTELSGDDLLDVVGAAPSQQQCPDNTYFCVTGPAICYSRVICP